MSWKCWRLLLLLPIPPFSCWLLLRTQPLRVGSEYHTGHTLSFSCSSKRKKVFSPYPPHLCFFLPWTKNLSNRGWKHLYSIFRSFLVGIICVFEYSVIFVLIVFFQSLDLVILRKFIAIFWFYAVCLGSLKYRSMNTNAWLISILSSEAQIIP